jgi:hypothetical protein
MVTAAGTVKTSLASRVAVTVTAGSGTTLAVSGSWAETGRGANPASDPRIVVAANTRRARVEVISDRV